MKTTTTSQWLRALREEGLQQAFNTMVESRGGTTSAYCCLGVAARCAGYTDVEIGWRAGTWSLLWDRIISDLPEEAYQTEKDGFSDIRLPFIFASWAGGPYETDGETVVTASLLNDLGFTFDQIADCIEYAWNGRMTNP